MAGRSRLVHPKWAKGRAPWIERCLLKAGVSSTEAIQEGKASGPKDEIPDSNDVASREMAGKIPRAIESHVPNAETAKVLREAREGKNLLRYESLGAKDTQRSARPPGTGNDLHPLLAR
jgi:hypothetical protein